MIATADEPGWLLDALRAQPGMVVSLVGGGGKTSLMFSLALEAWQRWGPGSVLVTTTTHIAVPEPSDLPAGIDRVPEVRLALVQSADEGCSRFEHEGRLALLVMGREIIPSAGWRPKVKGLPPEWVDEIAAAVGPKGVLVIVEADGAARRPFKAPAPHEPVFPATSDLVLAVVGVDVLGKPLQDEYVFRPERVATLTGLPLGRAVDTATVAAVICAPQGAARGKPPRARLVAVLNKVDAEEDRQKALLLARELRLRGMEQVLMSSTLRWPVLVDMVPSPLDRSGERPAPWPQGSDAPVRVDAGVSALRLRYKLWLEHEQWGKAFGDGPLRMLEGVQRLGSLRQAAAEMNMSYNQAWRLIRRLEQALGFPLLERQAGGTGGGGSTVTVEALELMERFRKFRDCAERSLEEAYRRFIFPLAKRR